MESFNKGMPLGCRVAVTLAFGSRDARITGLPPLEFGALAVLIGSPGHK
jgi:hypothetical protein